LSDLSRVFAVGRAARNPGTGWHKLDRTIRNATKPGKAEERKTETPKQNDY
jgi:hypothetical protein